MLRYYVYFYFCGAAITLYVAFLELRFEQMQHGKRHRSLNPAGNDESGRSSRVKRDTTSNDDEHRSVVEQLKEMLDEFRRNVRTSKLRRLQESGPSNPMMKAPLVKMVQNEPIMEISKRKTETEEMTHSYMDKGEKKTEKKKDKKEKKEKKKKKKKKKGKRRTKRSSKKQKTTDPPVHNADTNRDMYLSDPNEFFENEESDDVVKGLAYNWFVLRWVRTLTYFILLQFLIFIVLFMGFFTYGYAKYEIWKMKESKLYKFFKKIVAKDDAEPEVGASRTARKFNARLEKMTGKALAEQEKRQRAIERKMEQRERAREMQERAQMLLGRIQDERERREDAEAEKAEYMERKRMIQMQKMRRTQIEAARKQEMKRVKDAKKRKGKG